MPKTVEKFEAVREDEYEPNPERWYVGDRTKIGRAYHRSGGCTFYTAEQLRALKLQIEEILSRKPAS